MSEQKYYSIRLDDKNADFPEVVICVPAFHDEDGANNHELMAYGDCIGVMICRTRRGRSAQIAAAMNSYMEGFTEL